MKHGVKRLVGFVVWKPGDRLDFVFFRMAFFVGQRKSWKRKTRGFFRDPDHLLDGVPVSGIDFSAELCLFVPS